MAIGKTHDENSYVGKSHMRIAKDGLTSMATCYGTKARQHNVCSANALTRHIVSTIVAVVVMMLFGCYSGMYKISTSEEGKELDSKMNYSEVSTLNTEVEFDSSQMPVEIVHGREIRIPDKPGGSGILWLFSLGIFPMVETEYVTQDITVKTPLGVKSGSWRVDAKRWFGWLPIFIGYPDLADERDVNAKLPSPNMEQKAKDRLVDSLVREFSYDAYVKFANNKNKERKTECDHIAEVRQKINDLMAENKYDDAEQLRLKEAVNRAGTWACDAAVWRELAETIAEKKEIHRVAVERAREQQRVQDKKQKLTEQIKEGRFEEVIKACDEEKVDPGKDNPWSEIRNRALDALNVAIPTMNDYNRLVALYFMFDETNIKNVIVIRLSKLAKCASLGVDTLVNYVAMTSSEDGRQCAINAINDKDKLLAIAKAKYSEYSTVAVFKKLTANDVRSCIWSGIQIDDELASWYINIYGTDGELLKIIKTCGERLNAGIINLIRTRTESAEVLTELGKVEERINAVKLKEEIKSIAAGFGDVEVRKGLFDDLLPRIEEIKDKSVRQNVAELLLARNMQLNNQKVCLYNVGNHDKNIPRFINMLSEECAKKLFDDFNVEAIATVGMSVFPEDHKRDMLKWYGVSLFNRMSYESKKEACVAVESRMKESRSFVFKGFYVGMSLRDFCVVCAVNNQYPDWRDHYDFVVTRITFNREQRYALFEKEDDEFWDAFMHSYFPSATGYNREEDYDLGFCNVYKSMKFHTKILFQLKHGYLRMEHLR